MNKDIFDFTDYRAYLLDWIGQKPKGGRGIRALLAEAIHSPVSHISQVLKGISNLSMEQAEELNTYLGHSLEEAEYFLLLVQWERAGSEKLKKRIFSQLQRLKEKRLILKGRLEVKAEISQENQAQFYSSWQFAAVHILLTIKEFQNKDAIARHLGISAKRTAEILEFLISIGLAQNKDGRFTVGTARMHLGHDSPMITRHHINWRLQAIQSLENESGADLHYSSVVSIAAKDIEKIKSLLVKSIENTKALIRDSPEEELHSFCLDFFKV